MLFRSSSSSRPRLRLRLRLRLGRLPLASRPNPQDDLVNVVHPPVRVGGLLLDLAQVSERQVAPRRGELWHLVQSHQSAKAAFLVEPIGQPRRLRRLRVDGILTNIIK